MTYSSKTPCPDPVLPSTTVWFFSARGEAKSSHSTLHTSHWLHSSHSKLQTSHSTLHTSHFSLLTASFTLQTSHFTLHTSHCALRTPNWNFTLHTSHCTLHTSHFSLLTASFTLQTSHFTLHTSHCALRTPNWNFTLHTSHSTLHTFHFPLLPSHFTLHTALFTPHTSHCSKPTCNKKTLAPKWRKSADKSLSQPSCSHSKTIDEIQLQKTMVLRMLPQHEATLTQPLQCDLQRLSCKTQYRTTRNGVGNCSSKTGSRRQNKKKTILKHFLKGFLEGKSLAPKWRKSADKSLSQPSCSHSNTIYEVQLQKTIVLRMQPQHEATLTQPLQCDLQRLSCKTQ